MKILVQKFGGTSVASEESREHVYKKIEDAVNQGYALVVVVSAMGRNGDPYATDTLLNLIRNDYPKASKRELDIIFSCGENISGTIIASNLQKRGYKSTYLSGEQANIITDDNYSDAKIIRIETDRIMSLLKEGNIVVVGGGQGVSENGDITTLGRGGSDITGCALGVALNAFEIDIYTDVEGIMTADPRKVKDAVLLDEIGYEDCCSMAYKGAKVIHPRAVEAALKNTGIKLYVKSTFCDEKGTLICKDKTDYSGKLILTGVTGIENLVCGQIVSSEYKTYDKLLEIMNSAEFLDFNMYYGSNGIILVSDAKNFNIIKDHINAGGFEIINIEQTSEVSIIGRNIDKFPDFYESITYKINSSGIIYKMAVKENNYISFIIKNDNYIQMMNLLHEYLKIDKIKVGGRYEKL